MKFWNFFKESTDESSMRLVFIATTIATLVGLLIIDFKFAFNLVKYTGTEISLVIASNSAFLISVIYGKNKAKQIESTYQSDDSSPVSKEINNVEQKIEDSIKK